MEDFDSNLTAGNVKAAMKDQGFKHLSPELRKALAELLAGIKKP